MGFSNRKQRFTGSNYLDVDSPLRLTMLPMSLVLAGRSATQMQCVRHLLAANCWLGWWLRESDLQGLELSCR